MVDRNDPVVVTPNDERRLGCGQVEAVYGTHRLPARVDHGPHSADEGVPALGFRQRLEGAPHLRRLGVAEASAAEEPDDRVPPVRTKAGNRAGIAYSAPGRVMRRRIQFTSRPKPPASTSTRRSQRSGN